MATESKESEKKFQYNNAKLVSRSKIITLVLDITFGLLLAAMCVLLMSFTEPLNTINSGNSNDTIKAVAQN
jgi:hypothetical protein